VAGKQISKVIVYYTDGSYEELTKNTLWPSPNTMPFQYYPNKCMVCGGEHPIGLQCPSLSPVAYESGMEDPGK
jgi:hypothetical protein